MATLKRNHNPSNVMAECTACGHNASAPPGKRHRHCSKRDKGRWVKRESQARS